MDEFNQYAFFAVLWSLTAMFHAQMAVASLFQKRINWPAFIGALVFIVLASLAAGCI